MSKIAFSNKSDLVINSANEVNKVTAANLNEIKDSVNWLYENVSFPVYGAYQDTTYTDIEPQEIPADGFQTLVNNKGLTLIESLAGGSTLFEDNKILPRTQEDTFYGHIAFIAKSTSPNASFEFGIDIGGTFGVQFRETLRTSNTQNVYRPYFIPLTGYMAATFLANGGIPKIRSNTGTLSVYNCIIQITILTKAYA